MSDSYCFQHSTADESILNEIFAQHTDTDSTSAFKSKAPTTYSTSVHKKRYKVKVKRKYYLNMVRKGKEVEIRKTVHKDDFMVKKTVDISERRTERDSSENIVQVSKDDIQLKIKTDIVKVPSRQDKKDKREDQQRTYFIGEHSKKNEVELKKQLNQNSGKEHRVTKRGTEQHIEAKDIEVSKKLKQDGLLLKKKRDVTKAPGECSKRNRISFEESSDFVENVDFIIERNKVNQEEIIEQVVAGKSTYPRISVSKFVSVVLNKMPEEHKTAIRNIGFGGFLYLDIEFNNSAFAEKLVDSYDCDTCSLLLERGSAMKLSMEDIHLVYGLPFGGKKIIKVGLDEETNEEWINFLKRWREIFGMTKGSPTNLAVIAEIERLKGQPVCDEFLLHFVICAVNCCIRSTNSTNLNYKFLYSCMNVSEIGKLDWCRFAFEELKDSMFKWKIGSSFFTGPLPFLMICYFDRLQREDIVTPRRFPLISVWDRKMIQTRMKLEKNIVRGFGKGTVIPRMKYEGMINDEDQRNCEDKQFGQASASSENQLLDFICKFQQLAKDLGSKLNEMYSMLQQATDVFDEEEIASQMTSLIENIWKKYTTNRDSPREVTEKQDGLHNETQNHQEATEEHTQLSQDHYFFDEPGFIAEVDEIVAKAHTKSEEEKKKKSAGSFSPPTFNLLSHSSNSSSQGQEQETMMNEGRPMEDETDINCEERNSMRRCNDEIENKSFAENENTLYSQVHSTFLKKYGHILDTMDFQKRILVQYGFANLNTGETMYNDKLTYLDRGTIQSLSGNKVVRSTIVDAWANLLNIENKKRGNNSVNRFFFSTEPFVMLCTDTYVSSQDSSESSDIKLEYFSERLVEEMYQAKIKNFDGFELVFFPVVNPPTSYLLCVNFLNKTLDLIENQVGQTYGTCPSSMMKGFASFINSKIIDKNQYLPLFKTRIINMQWKSNANIEDFDVLLMKHMENYHKLKKNVWSCKIGKENIDEINALRILYCSRILTSQDNAELHFLKGKSKKWIEDNQS